MHMESFILVSHAIIHVKSCCDQDQMVTLFFWLAENPIEGGMDYLGQHGQHLDC